MPHIATDKGCECLRRLLSLLRSVELKCEKDVVQAGVRTPVEK